MEQTTSKKYYLCTEFETRRGMNVEIRVEIIIFFSSVFHLSSVAEKEKGTNPTFIPTDLFNKKQTL